MSEIKPAQERFDEWQAATEMSIVGQLLGSQFRFFMAEEVKELRAENKAQAKRIESLEAAFNEWITKTEFVQKDENKLFSKHLGKHRADAIHEVLLSQIAENRHLKGEVNQHKKAMGALYTVVDTLDKESGRRKETAVLSPMFREMAAKIKFYL